MGRLCVVEHGGLPTVVRPRYVVPRTLFIPNNSCRRLLEFRLNAESGTLYDTATLDVSVLNVCGLPGHGSGFGQKLLAHSPFLVIPGQSLVFDTRTRVFYKFPDLNDVALVCSSCNHKRVMLNVRWLIDH